MKVKLVLTEAAPPSLWTHGEVKNVSAPGHPTVTPADCVLKDGASFIANPGTHTYRFLIKGDGSVKVQAIDLDTGAPIAPAGAFDTKEAHGGHTYVFGVV